MDTSGIFYFYYGVSFAFDLIIASALGFSLQGLKRQKKIIPPIYMFKCILTLDSLSYLAAAIIRFFVDIDTNFEAFLYLDVYDALLIGLFPTLGVSLVNERIPWANIACVTGVFILFTVVYCLSGGSKAVVIADYTFLVIYVVTVQIWVIRQILKQSRQLPHYFDNPKERKKTWFIPLAAASTFLLVSTLPNYLGADMRFYNILNSLLWAVLYMIIWGKLLTLTSSKIEMELSKISANKVSRESIARLLESEFILKRQYLKEGLTLDDLARTCKTNRTYMGEYLKNVLSVSFSDYVNGYRIKEADVLLPDKTISLEAIAMNCGFGNVRTFRRAWEKVHQKKLVRHSL